MKKIAYSLTAILALSGCNLAPIFTLPEAPTTDQFKEAASYASTWKESQPQTNIPRGEWWVIFNDEKLNALEKEAEAGNLTVAAMAERVKQARENFKISTTALIPSIDANTSYTRSQPNPLSRGMASGTSLPIENNFRAGLGLNYEFDLFGGLQNKKNISFFGLKESEDSLEDVKLALQADIAEMYFAIAALDNESALIEETLVLREESLRLLKKRLEFAPSPNLM